MLSCSSLASREALAVTCLDYPQIIRLAPRLTGVVLTGLVFRLGDVRAANAADLDQGGWYLIPTPERIESVLSPVA